MSQSRSSPHWRRLVPSALLTGLAAALLTARADPAPRATRPDPLDPKASVPAVAYQSSFARYRLLGDEKPVSWKDANDTVARIGGWRVYAREAQQPDTASGAQPTSPAVPASAPTSPEAARPMPGGHGGHKTP